LTDAVIVAAPAATAVIVNVALDELAGIVTDAGTVATAALLVESEIVAPPATVEAFRVTVPCPLVPAATLAAFSETLETAGVVVVAAVGEPEPPH
jgi:hypothetical protein